MSDQQDVQDYQEGPFNSTCRLIVTRRRARVQSKDFTSTGLLLGNKHILTAAHNFATFRFLGIPSRAVYATCRIAGHGNEEILDIADFWRPASVDIPRRYRKYVYRYDYCLLTLKNELNISSDFELPEMGAMNLAVDDEVFVAGYPDGSKLMQWGKGRVTNISDHLFTYDVDTETGNSGGPVWRKTPEGKFQLVGVHVSAARDSSRGQARLVNDELLTALNGWGLQ